ncbi:MAG: DUF6629 family protein [Bacteroidia bacterium]
MCFSASASFGAGAVLSVIGVASLKQVKTPSEIPFASIPLIFAVQQITEGLLWLSFADSGNASLQMVTSYVFLFIAQVIWPFWVPFSVFKIEPNVNRKKILGILVGLGSVVSLYLLFCLFNYTIEANIDGYHIAYMQDYPAALSKYGGMLYVIATIVPPLYCSLKRMSYLGLSILVSYVISTVFYQGYVVSVWCFFAAIISILVYAVMVAVKGAHEDILPRTVFTTRK